MSHPTMRQLAADSGVQFGTSGVRGLVANMTDALCYAWAQSFLAVKAGQGDCVVVGHDLRPSSPAIAGACIRAIRDAGRQPVFVGALPTPALAHFCADNKWPGIMVTGSHIPFDRNGIKFYRADGEIDKADEQAIMDVVVNVPAGLLTPSVSLPTVDESALNAYVQRYVEFFGTGALRGRRIAVYEHSSVARDVLRTILTSLGADVLSLGRTDTFVPIDTEAVRAEDIAQAREWAVQNTFDALLSTDGDADRPLIGDEKGQWMRGDVVGILCAQVLQADVVVTPVSSNTGLEKCGSFKRVVRTRIGSPYVIAGMDEARHQHASASIAVSASVNHVDAPEADARYTPAVIAGYEANGGFLLGSAVTRNGVTMSALPTRDSVLPMLALLTLAASRGVPMSALTSDLPPRFTASDRIQQIPTASSQTLISQLSEDPSAAVILMAPASGSVTEQDTTDGLRITFANGDIVHLRPSGNAPELRCYAEADTQAKAEQLCQSCLAAVKQRLTG